jgi:hypothetical protein
MIDCAWSGDVEWCDKQTAISERMQVERDRDVLEMSWCDINKTAISERKQVERDRDVLEMS